MNTPSKKKFFMPAEWHEHDCCWMQWPNQNTNFSGYGGIPSWSHFNFEKGKIAWAKVAKVISEFEKVKMIVNPINVQNAKAMLDSKVEIIAFANDDGWSRDSGAIFLLDKNMALSII